MSPSDATRLPPWFRPRAAADHGCRWAAEPGAVRRRSWCKQLSEAALRLKAQRLDLDHVGQSADGVEDDRHQRLVDLDESDRLTAGCGAAEVKGRNVHPSGAERIAQRANETGFVG